MTWCSPPSDSSAPATDDPAPVLVGSGAPVRELVRAIELAAALGVIVLVAGEKGTGREAVARAIHRRRRRSAAGFFYMHCDALVPPVPGAKPSDEDQARHSAAAVVDALDRAHGGTVFLDEVERLSARGHDEIHRALLARRRSPVCRSIRGGDTQLIASMTEPGATQRPAGAHRVRLFDQLQVLRVRVPALRERREDIPSMARYLLDQHARALGRETCGFAPDALRVLEAYAWPGNLRELEAVVVRAGAMATGQVVTALDLPVDVRTAPRPRRPSAVTP